jgi:hypothetical protein
MFVLGCFCHAIIWGFGISLAILVGGILTIKAARAFSRAVLLVRSHQFEEGVYVIKAGKGKRAFIPCDEWAAFALSYLCSDRFPPQRVRRERVGDRVQPWYAYYVPEANVEEITNKLRTFHLGAQVVRFRTNVGTHYSPNPEIKPVRDDNQTIVAV